MKRCLFTAVLICLFVSSGALAAEKKSPKKAEKKAEPKVEKKAEPKVEKKAEKNSPSKWSLSAGVRSRDLDVEFSAAAPSSYADWASLVRRPRNTGSTDIDNGTTPRTDYEDGEVVFDPSWTWVDGTSLFGMDNDAQLGIRDVFNTVTFGSTRTRQWSELSQTALEGEDDTTKGGAYVAARRAIGDKGLGCLVQYGINVFEIDSGWQETARQTIMERQTRYATTYDIYGWGSAVTPAPFEGGDVSEWVVVDAALHNAFYGWMGLGDAMEPRQTQDARQRTLAVLTASSKTDLDVDVHDLLLGLEWALPIGDWLSLSLAAGPTLNVISWDLEHTTEWINQTTGAALQTMQEKDGDDEFEVGAAAQVTVRLNMDKKGRVFCEGSAAYNWVDKIDASTESASAEIDVSSFSGSAGIGIRL